MPARGIRVNDVCPGMIQTPMSERMIADGQGPQVNNMLQTFVPMKRLDRPEEIAGSLALQREGQRRTVEDLNDRVDACHRLRALRARTRSPWLASDFLFVMNSAWPPATS